MKADLSCGERCKWPAVVILVLTGLIYFAAVAMVVRFYVRFSNEVYKPAEAASSPADVQDPFLRFLQSRLRGFRNLFAHVATRQRTRGSFQPGKEATEEPARTERLLSRPLALLRARDSDALDQLQPLLGDGRGNRLAYVSYNILTLTVNITLGIIAGAVTDKTDVAQATIAIKISFAAWLILLSPMKDRLTCWVNAIQFLLEGIAASIALSETASAAASAHCAASSQAGPAFYTGIAAVLVPILLLLYDSLFVKVYLISKGTKKVTLAQWSIIIFGTFLKLVKGVRGLPSSRRHLPGTLALTTSSPALALTATSPARSNILTCNPNHSGVLSRRCWWSWAQSLCGLNGSTGS